MTFTDLQTGRLSGDKVAESRKTVGDLESYWRDAGLIRNAEEALYSTQTFECAPGGTEGVVLWGNTVLQPGRVGDEFFMTRGHRHLKSTHGELCITVSGHGVLLLMSVDRKIRSEDMTPGSTHWIDGGFAHRTVNTGDEPLVFLCAWPADCGHDYDEVASRGFSARLLCRDGNPTLVNVD